jgi:hypothetical protein
MLGEGIDVVAAIVEYRGAGVETRGVGRMGGADGVIEGAVTTTVGGVRVDEVAAGRARVKRMTYPVGWNWRDDMQPVTGSDWCTHAHVGFMAAGAIAIRYSDGCRVDYAAPAVVVVEPGHEGWVIGDEPAVLVQIDCDVETVDRLGLAGAHRHE